MATSSAVEVRKLQRPGKWVVYPRDFLVALSLANLCYMRVWEALLDRRYSFSLLAHSPNRNLLLGATACVLVFGLLCAGVTTVVRNVSPHYGEKLGRAVFIVTLVVPVLQFCWVLRKKYPFFDDFFTTRKILAICGITIVLALVTWWKYRGAARVVAIVLICFSPLIAINFGQVIGRLASHDADPLADRPTVPPNPNAPRHLRVLWFIFDEWDYKFTFVTRQPDLKLPEIDRFAQTALYATAAAPPASRTVRSVPMLLTGERYTGDYRFTAADRFEVIPFNEPGRWVSWGSRDLIFGDVRALGLNTALAGWYLPYCRLVSDQLNACTWFPLDVSDNAYRDDTVGHAMVDETRSLFEATSFSPFGSTLAAIRHVHTYRSLMAASIRLVTDPRYGLVFCHIPVPHHPYPYDRATQTFSSKIGYDPHNYFNGLALLDLTIGELRRALEAAGQWDDSVILFSTDHFFRGGPVLDGTHHWRVPFLLKMPHQDHAIAFEKRFNTISSKNLLMAILRGEVRTPEEASNWLAHYAIDCPTIGSSSE